MSFGKRPGFTNDLVSQSSWPLDPEPNFLTRTSSYYGGTFVYNTSLSSKNTMRPDRLAPAGELQSHVYRYGLGARPNRSYNSKAAIYPRISAIYSRCHTLDTINSVVSPYGPQIPSTGSTRFYSASFETANRLSIFGSGEALWEAGANAGITRLNSGSNQFVLAPSEPWWNDYDSFKEDLNLKAKGFAVIPEFRISEHIDEYERVGPQTMRKTGINTFDIPGTNVNSGNSNFYKDYSNSDFLQEFLNIKKETLLSAKEIRLSCTGAIRYNAYKGFYPVQRSLDLVSQFSRSFGEAFIVSSSGGGGSADGVAGGEEAQGVGAIVKHITDPVFSPGILYNSIKSGIAVDYPLVHDGTKLKFGHYGADLQSGGSNNFALTITGSLGTGSTSGTSKLGYFSGSTGYKGGQFWDRRLPFEAIIRPKSFLPGYSYQNMEAHPSMSCVRDPAFKGTASMTDVGDNTYNLMARNFFGETANFFTQ